MKKFILLFLSLLFVFPWQISAAEEITSKAQLNEPGRVIGISQGSVVEGPIKKEMPNAEISYFTDIFLGYEAAASGKIDAFVYDKWQLELAIKNGQKGVRLLDETLNEGLKIAVGISSVSKIPDLENRLNQFIAELRADGTLDEMFTRWVADNDEDNHILPEIKLPEDPQYHLVVGTAGIVPPFSYYKGSELNGYDIELAYRFAAWLGADLRFEVIDFGGLIPAAQSGKIDCIMSNLQVEDERRENFTFSDVLFEEKEGILVRAASGDSENGNNETAPGQKSSAPEFTSFSELNGKTISMLTGAPFEEMIRSKVPDVGKFTYLNNMPDLIMALETGKTDAVLSNNAVSMLSINRNAGEVTLFPESLQDGVFGFAFAKGSPDRDIWQAALDKIPESTKQAVWEKWTGSDESLKVMPEQDWPGANGTIQAAVIDTVEPMSYTGKNGQIMGIDPELILLMAKELDVHVQFTGMDLSSILASVQSGKTRIGGGSIIISEERAEAVDFVPYFPAAFVLVVRTATQAEEAEHAPTFWDSITSSFEKTFIRENRWKLIVLGTVNTMIITVLSVILGTFLGFLLFMLCRRGNPAVNRVTDICLWLVRGTPMVVLLMILFYVVFASVPINAIAVAVIGFSLVFGASVFGLLKMGVGAIDNGQYEAAYALGYSNRRTFFSIILPQAIPHIASAYRGEIIGLLKATAVVGYIAVQDLTKMGDIIRSRTYEAFFPLIAVTVIYFLLELLLGFLIGKIELRQDPKRRRPEDILKGVKVHD